MEGWRQRRMKSIEDHSTNKGNCKTHLTLTGLLMEGLGTLPVRQMIVLELAIVVDVETLRDSSAQSSVAATNSQQQITRLHFYS
jgi:hypothetical protein